MNKTDVGSDFHEADDESRGFSRRDFLKAAAGLAGMPLAGAAFGAPPAPPNILFLLTDQERVFRPGELPIGYELPGHAQLMQRGTTFVNHRINSCVCTPSRSVIYTGHSLPST